MYFSSDLAHQYLLTSTCSPPFFCDLTVFLSVFLPCPPILLVQPPPPLCMMVVPQMAIFSYETDINGTSTQRKSKREGHDEIHLSFFHVTYSVKHPGKGSTVRACVQVGTMQMMLWPSRIIQCRCCLSSCILLIVLWYLLSVVRSNQFCF